MPFTTSSYMYTGDPRPTLILTYQSDSFFHHIEFSSKFYEPVRELYKLKNKCAMKIYIHVHFVVVACAGLNQMKHTFVTCMPFNGSKTTQHNTSSTQDSDTFYLIVFQVKTISK